MKKIALRRARKADAGAAADLLAGLGKGFQATAAQVARRLRKTTDAVFVAVVGREILGLVATHTYQPVHSDVRYGRIVTIVVRPGRKRRGVGRAMMTFALGQLRRLGCRKIELTSRVYRGGAHHFYRAMGFRVTSKRFSRALAV